MNVLCSTWTILLALVACVDRCVALGAVGWREQSIYQIVTDRFARTDGRDTVCDLDAKQFCGGTWRGIVNKLDYIQDMGFTAIWISPVVENLLPNGYHGYYAQNIWKHNSQFGTTDDLKALSAALHSRGMFLMVDVVANHVVTPIAEEFTASSTYGMFDQPEDYHPFRWVDDYNDQWLVENGWIPGIDGIALVDLNTESEKVVRCMYDWVGWLVREYGIDGLRVDSVKHVRRDFWPGFTRASSVFCMGEVLHGDAQYTYSYQHDSIESVINYPTYFPLVRTFSSPLAGMHHLYDAILTAQHIAKDVTVLGTFLDNHDQKRFAHTVSDHSLRLNALAFPFVSDGIPISYYGAEQGYEGGDDPFNREALWHSGYHTDHAFAKHLRSLNRIRAWALRGRPEFATTPTTPYLLNAHDILLHRPPLLSLLSSRGSQQREAVAQVVATIPELEAGTVLVEVLDDAGMEVSGKTVVVGEGGIVTFEVVRGLPQIFLPLNLFRSLNIPFPHAVSVPASDAGQENEIASISDISWRPSEDSWSVMSASDGEEADREWVIDVHQYKMGTVVKEGGLSR